jgi:hypothetical protein
MELDKQLIPLWENILACKKCGLPRGFSPQFRPVGRRYKPGGIVFVQINPGQVGLLTNGQIQKRYKTVWRREIARHKTRVTSELLDCQKKFQKNNCSVCWKAMCRQYRKAMSNVWGWPPGNFRKTIENHNVSFDNIAVVNLAQCPVPNNRYRKSYLETCWCNFTQQLIEVLAPRLIVAQGKQAYGFLSERTGKSSNIIRGVHHASRECKAEREVIFSQVINSLSGYGAIVDKN